MGMAKTYAIYLCGTGETPLAPRDECPNSLHDHPLPKNMLDEMVVAEERLETGWENPTCPDCKMGGWVPPEGTVTEL